MKIELTTEQDAVDYIDFLKATEGLSAVIGKIELEGEEAEGFFRYKAALIQEPTAAVPPSNTPPRAGVAWSKEDDKALRTLIQDNASPAAIAKILERQESGVRSRASRDLNKGYSGNRWWNKP
mgnify:CR=1 FL=1